MQRPKPILIHDGSILVPISDGRGGYEDSRVTPDDDDYAYWRAAAVSAGARPPTVVMALVVTLAVLTVLVLALVLEAVTDSAIAAVSAAGLFVAAFALTLWWVLRARAARRALRWVNDLIGD